MIGKADHFKYKLCKTTIQIKDLKIKGADAPLFVKEDNLKHYGDTFKEIIVR